MAFERQPSGHRGRGWHRRGPALRRRLRPVECRASSTWACRLSKVFSISIVQGTVVGRVRARTMVSWRISPSMNELREGLEIVGSERAERDALRPWTDLRAPLGRRQGDQAEGRSAPRPAQSCDRARSACSTTPTKPCSLAGMSAMRWPSVASSIAERCRRRGVRSKRRLAARNGAVTTSARCANVGLTRGCRQPIETR